MEPDASLEDIGLEAGSVEIISQSAAAITPAPITPAPISAAPSPAPVDPVAATPAPIVSVLPPAPDPVPPPPPAPAPEPPITDDTPITDDAYTDDGTTYYDDGLTEPVAPLEVFTEPVTGATGATVEEFIEQSSTSTQTITTQAPGGGGTTPAPEAGGGGTTPAPEAGGEETPTNTSPVIAGGVLTDHTAVNTEEGDEKIVAAVSAEVVIPEAGERTIEPIDCAGLTGEMCCLRVKLAIPDSDINGKAIQCSLTYEEHTEKMRYWRDLRGKKVHIMANHKGKVNWTPFISGYWPDDGKEGAEFEQWVLEGGAPPLALQAGLDIPELDYTPDTGIGFGWTGAGKSWHSLFANDD